MQKQVVVINHLLEPANRITGITKYLFSLLNSLLDQDVFDYVLVTNWHAEHLPEGLQRRNLKVETLAAPDSTPLSLLYQSRLLPAIMRRHGAVLEFNPNPLGAFVGGWPRVNTIHDLYFDINPGQYKFRHLLWWRLLFPLVARSAKRLICVSAQTRSDLERFHKTAKGKSVVIHEASTLEATASLPQREGFGLFVANVSPNKGSDILVEAMAKLAARQPELAIYHIGRSNGAFARAQEKHGTTAGPKEIGNVSDSELADYYSRARFLAFPSTYEGFGLPILEAQTFGAPVIATDLPVLREVAGDGAAYFPGGDADALADRMEKLLTDDEAWGRLHVAALDNARKFSWSKAAEETAALFRTVIG